MYAVQQNIIKHNPPKNLDFIIICCTAPQRAKLICLHGRATGLICAYPYWVMGFVENVWGLPFIRLPADQGYAAESGWKLESPQCGFGLCQQNKISFREAVKLSM